MVIDGPARWVFAAGALCALAATAMPNTYDAAAQQLRLPAVTVGERTFADVRLRDEGGYTFVLQDATEQTPPGPGRAAYDPATGVLTLPAVHVGDAVFHDVALRDLGGFRFALQAATELPRAALDGIRTLLAANDALFATAVPATGNARLALSDACYRHDGRTRAWLLAAIDANLAYVQAHDAHQVGRRSENLAVLAVRSATNPDGSTRQEIDIEYDIVYTDGTKVERTRQTAIRGSSAGTPGCATAQAGDGWRFLGNQRLVGVAVTARSVRDERYTIAAGAPLAPPVEYRRRVDWNITDPLGHASYVIVSGPGPGREVGGVMQPFSLKFVSTRLLRSAPELQGRTGNFLNWRDDDGFRYCRAAGAADLPPLAALADCAGLGAAARDYGWATTNPNADADAGFAAQGWVAGGVYRFDVYADDGWKTVNGHAGRTPVATYHDTLDALPYPFVEMARSGSSGGLFPFIDFGARTPAQVRDQLVAVTPVPIAVEWDRPLALPDGRPFALILGWEFHQGPKAGNAGGAFNPAYRTIAYHSPGSAATSIPALAISPLAPGQERKSYAEFTLMYGDRNDRQVLGIVSFR